MSAALLITVVVRASVLLALGLGALHILPMGRPRFRRFVCLFCLGASLVVPFFPVLSSPFLPAFSGSASGISKTEVAALTRIFSVLWIVGGMLAAWRLVRRAAALHHWIGKCEVWRPILSFSPGLTVRVCPRSAAPCVAGLFRPSLVVPAEARSWSAETWRCVLAHEWQHVRQGDLWLGWISHAVRVLHWWNPLAWQLIRSVGLECEACCDDAVLRFGVKAADYAHVLLRFTTTEPLLLQPADFFIHGGIPSRLRLRMERLLSDDASRPSVWRVIAAVGLLAAGMAGCAWIGFGDLPPLPSASAGAAEAALRWQANPFPADR